jgi:hypothetical protein
MHSPPSLSGVLAVGQQLVVVVVAEEAQGVQEAQQGASTSVA